MKKLTLVCIVAMAAFMMSSCGNRNAKKAAEVQTVETEVVAPETICTGDAACCEKAECKCVECKCAEGNCETCACEECKCAEIMECSNEITVAEVEPAKAE